MIAPRQRLAGTGARLLARIAGAGGLALLALVVLWGPWRGIDSGHGAAWESHVAWADSVITGTVSWKGTETPAGNVQVVLKDPKQGTVVAEATTDATGTYLLASA